MSLFKALPKYYIKSRFKVLDLSYAHIMGILNTTPDSFSDGGQFNAVDKALEHCKQMIASGATIIDIGGESTRPNAEAVETKEEIQRVIPVVKAIRDHCGHNIWLSIDTSNPDVIQAAFESGADMWNDVRALKRNGAAAMAAKLEIPVILMHMRGEPSTMNDLAVYDDVVDDVVSELRERIDEAVSFGVKRDKMIIDPGFGFAKNFEHHCALLTKLTRLQTLDLPILFGVSRKRFLAEILKNSSIESLQSTQALERDAVGMAAGLLALQQGASIIRTHNVAMMQQAVTLWQQMSDYQDGNDPQ